jgi:hypothetical protein
VKLCLYTPNTPESSSIYPVTNLSHPNPHPCGDDLTDLAVNRMCRSDMTQKQLPAQAQKKAGRTRLLDRNPVSLFQIQRCRSGAAFHRADFDQVHARRQIHR